MLSFPSSIAMLKLGLHVVDVRLTEDVNNVSAYMFWLFLLRIAETTPDSLNSFRQIFMKHAGNIQMVLKEHVLETIFEIIDESLLVGIFTTEEEVISIVNFATNTYKRLYSVLQQKLQNGTHAADKITAIMEANAAVVSVLETIFIKYIQPTGTVENTIMLSMQPFLEFSIQQTATVVPAEYLQYSSKFNTMLIAMMSRLLVYNAPAVITLMQSMGLPLGEFLRGWVSKMDFIATHYGRRLNLLAILSILPFIGVELLQAFTGKLMGYVLPLVENYIFTKDSRSDKRSSSAALTPTKPVKHDRIAPKNRDAAQSDRKAAMRGEDVTANIELDTYFYMKYEQICKMMNLVHTQIRSLIEKEGKLASMLDSIINSAHPV